jgi:ribonuclease HIII
MQEKGRVIGVDESGKGDFFGPLVVAGCLVTDDSRARLGALGVRDGKTIANLKLRTIAEQIAATLPHVVVILWPEEYNRRYKEIANLNKLLATGHADCIEQLLAEYKADIAISDKFGKPELVQGELHRRGIDIVLEQIVRGEQFLCVAAASILARAAFLDAMDTLSEKWGIEIPRGAAPQVDAAGRRLVQKHGVEALSKVAKIHFKNFKRVAGNSLFA